MIHVVDIKKHTKIYFKVLFILKIINDNYNDSLETKFGLNILVLNDLPIIFLLEKSFQDQRKIQTWLVYQTFQIIYEFMVVFRKYQTN